MEKSASSNASSILSIILKSNHLLSQKFQTLQKQNEVKGGIEWDSRICLQRD